MDSPLGRSIDDEVVLVGSCNGIVGLIRGNVLFLWNPWTREYKATQFKSHLGSHSSIHGFGLSDNSGFYVMRFVNAMSSNSFNSTLRVFSVENPTSIVSMEVPFTLMLSEPGVFSKGSVFWVGRDSDGYSIVGYSLGEGKVEKVSMLSCLSRDAYVIPAMLKENLCILTKDVSSRDIDIWSRVSTKSWVKIFTINVAAFRTPIKSTLWPYNERYVVPIQMNGDEILFKHGAEVYWLDTKEEGDRELEIEDKIKDWSKRYILHPYIPSLLSLESGCFMTGDTFDALLLPDAQACQDFKDKMSPSLESLNHVDTNGDEVHPPPPKTLLPPPSPTTTY